MARKRFANCSPQQPSGESDEEKYEDQCRSFECQADFVAERLNNNKPQFRVDEARLLAD